MDPLISVIIPTRNRRAYLQEALRSIMALEKQICDVIVINDGSTDDTDAMLARDFPRVKVVQGHGQDMQIARNTGVEYATTPWLMLLDDDDLLKPQLLNYFEQALALFPKIQAFVPDFYKFRDDKIILESKQAHASAWLWQKASQEDSLHELYYYERLPLKSLLEYQFVFASGMMMTKAIYQAIGGFDPATRGIKGNDFEFTWRLLRHAPVAVCKVPLVGIRKHTNNDSGNENLLMIGDLQTLEIIKAKSSDVEPNLAQEVDDKINWMRNKAIDSAFVLCDVKTLRLYAAKQQWQALSWRQRWKYLIALLPHPIARAIMRTVQSLRPAQ
jgi:glycosyltransferase involved in cell wall biosynthesis